MTAGVRALVIWLSIAVVFGVAVAVIPRSASSLDDPDPANQRAGYLDAVGDRRAAPLVTISRPAAGKVTVVFFVRNAQKDPLLSALAEPKSLPAGVDAAVVGGRPDLAENRFASVSDVDAALAGGYGMPIPRDGGYPVGYAIVGPDRTVRYRTLDPGVVDRLDEVRTMLAALQ